MADDKAQEAQLLAELLRAQKAGIQNPNAATIKLANEELEKHIKLLKEKNQKERNYRRKKLRNSKRTRKIS